MSSRGPDGPGFDRFHHAANKLLDSMGLQGQERAEMEVKLEVARGTDSLTADDIYKFLDEQKAEALAPQPAGMD